MAHGRFGAFARPRYGYRKYYSNAKQYRGGYVKKPVPRRRGYGRKGLRKPVMPYRGANRTPREVNKLEVDVRRNGCCVPDVVMNGAVRVRGTLLTHPGPLLKAWGGFSGKANWYGVGENLKLELDGRSSLSHRRIVFQSTIPWQFPMFGMDDSGALYRAKMAGLDDRDSTASLLRLLGLGRPRVRELFYGKVDCKGVVVLEDKLKQYEGKDYDVRRQAKYWNTFGKGKKGQVNEHELQPNGSYPPSLKAGTDGAHVYVVDLFTCGLAAFDLRVPVAADFDVRHNAKGNDVKENPAKKVKTEKSIDEDMMEVTLEDDVFARLRGQEDEVNGEDSSGARVVSTLRVCWNK